MGFARWGVADSGAAQRANVEQAKGNPLEDGFDRLLAEPKRKELFPYIRGAIAPADDGDFNFQLWDRYRVYVYAAIRVSVDQMIAEFVLHADPEAANKRIGRPSFGVERRILVADKGKVANRLTQICAAVRGAASETDKTRARSIVSWLDHALAEMRWRELIHYFHNRHGLEAVRGWIAGAGAPNLDGMPSVWRRTPMTP
jgi:hypothetical protein